MKVISRGFNPNLGEEFMQRHGNGFVLARCKPPESKPGTESGAPREADSEDSPQLGALRIARMRHQNAQFQAQSGKKPG